MIEGMASLAAATRPRTPRPPSLSPEVPVQFLYARTCYGHLAGEVAVKALEAMLRRGWIAARGRDFAVTSQGATEFSALGVDLSLVRQPRRVFARTCIDLTQRRPHLGGALGEALLEVYVRRGWVKCRRQSRAVSITPKGHENFRRLFDS
jgi:hypothetical protein